MSDEPAIQPPIPPLAEIGSLLAPIVYFDSAPNFGFRNEIASVTLEAVTYLHTGDGMRTERRAVVHLRMTRAGLHSLKGAINSLELAMAPTEGTTVN